MVLTYIRLTVVYSSTILIMDTYDCLYTYCDVPVDAWTKGMAMLYDPASAPADIRLRVKNLSVSQHLVQISPWIKDKEWLRVYPKRLRRPDRLKRVSWPNVLIAGSLRNDLLSSRRLYA